MREILFRVWKIDAERMIDGNDVIIDFVGNRLSGIKSRPHITSQRIETCGDISDQFVLMQYIGIQDAIGQKIFEGDVVGDRYPKEICFSDYHGGFVGRLLTERDQDLKYAGQPLTQEWFDTLGITIIGNIYLNPELLK